MVTSRDLTTKQKMVDVIQHMPEDCTIDDAIYRLGVLKAISEGLKDVEDGKVIDHNDLFEELLNDDEKSADKMDGPGRRRSARTKAADSTRRRAKKGA